MSRSPTAKDRARWDQLHARRAVAQEKFDAEERRLHEKMGWDRKRETVSRIDDQIYNLLDVVSPRDWRHGAPAHWVASTLTWDDAIRPTTERLSVEPPIAYGHSQPIAGAHNLGALPKVDIRVDRVTKRGGDTVAAITLTLKTYSGEAISESGSFIINVDGSLQTSQNLFALMPDNIDQFRAFERKIAKAVKASPAQTSGLGFEPAFHAERVPISISNAKASLRQAVAAAKEGRCPRAIEQLGDANVEYGIAVASEAAAKPGGGGFGIPELAGQILDAQHEVGRRCLRKGRSRA